jgi:hypothetical protein
MRTSGASRPHKSARTALSDRFYALAKIVRRDQLILLSKLMFGLCAHQLYRARPHGRACGLHGQWRCFRDLGCKRYGSGTELLLRDKHVGKAPGERLFCLDATAG